MKRLIAAGLAVILPLLITLRVIHFIINFLTMPFLNLTEYLIYGAAHQYPLFRFLETPQIMHLLSQILILGLLLLTLLFVGFLGQIFILNGLFSTFDKIIHKIPLANKIYKAAQDVIQTFFSKEGPSFSNPVQVSFPLGNSQAIGFITNDHVKIEGLTEDYVAISVIGAPNPMMGVLLLMPKDKISPLSLSSEESMKFLLSCGTMKHQG